MANTRIVDALSSTSPVAVTLTAHEKLAQLVQRIVMTRLEQAFPGRLKRIIRNQYELDLRPDGGPLFYITVRVITLRDFFWNNVAAGFAQDQEVAAAQADATPILLACVLNPSADRVMCWQIAFGDLLAALRASAVPPEAKSFRIEHRTDGWRIRYEGGYNLNLDGIQPHEIVLGDSEGSERAAVKALTGQLPAPAPLINGQMQSFTSATDEVNAEASNGFAEEDSDDEAARVDDRVLQRMRDTLLERGQVILQGPPGTGKTHYALRFVEMCCGRYGASEADGREIRERARFERGQSDRAYPKGLEGRETAWALVQFHPSYQG